MLRSALLGIEVLEVGLIVGRCHVVGGLGKEMQLFLSPCMNW